MNDFTDVVFAANLVDDPTISDVAFNQGDIQHPLFVAEFKRIEYHDIATLGHEQANGVGTDIARTSSYKYRH